MTLVRFKNRNMEPSFNNLMDDFFTPFASIYKDDARTGLTKPVPVNIKETEKDYVLELVAPGWGKEAFKLNLENNLLTISAEKENEETTEGEKFLKKEFTRPSFKRSFTIDEKIDAENISANYTNGVLTVSLPKKAEVKAPEKRIAVQ